jgi:hypothetical protein
MRWRGVRNRVDQFHSLRFQQSHLLPPLSMAHSFFACICQTHLAICCTSIAPPPHTPLLSRFGHCLLSLLLIACLRALTSLYVCLLSLISLSFLLSLSGPARTPPPSFLIPSGGRHIGPTLLYYASLEVPPPHLM